MLLCCFLFSCYTDQADKTGTKQPDGSGYRHCTDICSYGDVVKVTRIEDPADWTEEKIRTAAAKIDSDKGPEGDFDD